MYAPCAPRPKSTNITRTRTGCIVCRRRRKRCDGRRPDCSACVRLQLHCDYGTRLKFCTDVLSNIHGPTVTRTFSEVIDSPPSDDFAVYSSSNGLDTSNGPFTPPNEASNPQEPYSPDMMRNASVWNDQQPHEHTQSSVTPSPGDLTDISNRWLSSIDVFETVLNYFPHDITSSDSCLLSNMSTVSGPSNQPSPPTPLFASVYAPRYIDNAPLSFSLGSSPDNEGQAVEGSRARPEKWFEGTVEKENIEIFMPADHISPSQEALYLSHWHSFVQDLLPGVLRELTAAQDKSSALRAAMMALAACNFAQVHPRMEDHLPQAQTPPQHTLDASYQDHGRLYYNIAIREFCAIEVQKRNLIDMLATLVLFIYIETDIGSYRRIAFHHNGVERLVTDNRDEFLGSHQGGRLICVWLHLRALSWRFRIPFRAFDFQIELAEKQIDVMKIFRQYHAHDETVIAIMTTSWYLSHMVLFERFAGRGDLEFISSRCTRDYFEKIGKPITYPWSTKVPIPDADYLVSLRQQEAYLDEWHSSLPITDLPVESFDKARMRAEHLNEEAEVIYTPLRFHSHRAAMNYVYYIFARIAQSSDALEYFLKTPSKLTPDAAAIPSTFPHIPWLLLLFRVVAGLNLLDCARYNIYSFSIIEILYNCAFRFPRSLHAIRKVIDDLVEKLSGIGVSREGTYPLHIFDRHFDEIELENEHGREAFFLIPADTADMEWNSSLKYQSKSPGIIYGRDRATGKFFCRHAESGIDKAQRK